MLLDIIVPVVHVIACIFLIIVVLLQSGKGADMGAVFGGGGNQTLFGATGAGNLLTKLTTGMAVTFMITSLTLAVARREQGGSDLLERLPDVQQPIVPPVPAPTGAATIDVTPKAAPAPADTAAPAPDEAGAVDVPATNDAAPTDAPAEAPAPTP